MTSTQDTRSDVQDPAKSAGGGGFSRTVGVELLRLRLRRGVLVILALGLLAIIAGMTTSVISAAPPSDSERATAQQRLEQDEANGAFTYVYDEVLPQCYAAVAAGGSEGYPAGEYPSEQACDDAFLPSIDMYLYWNPPSFVDNLLQWQMAVAAIAALIMLLIGATFVGAQFSSGTIETQLTYQPRRVAVLAGKAGAVAIMAIAVAVVAIALAWLASYLAAAWWGSTDLIETVSRHRVMPDGGVWTDTTEQAVTVAGLIGRSLRAALLVVGAAWGGMALSVLTRRSGVAIGIVAAYMVLVESAGRVFIEGLDPWLLSNRLQAWLNGPIDLIQWPRQCGMYDPCLPTVSTVSVAGGGLYLLIGVGVVCLAATFWFSRRDVK